MRIEQSKWTDSDGWTQPVHQGGTGSSQLVLLFGGTEAIQRTELLETVMEEHPDAWVLGCSTAGEICSTEVSDDTLICTAITFDRSSVQGISCRIGDRNESEEVGSELARSLDREGLSHVFVLSDGLRVNGSALVKGLTQGLPSNVTVTGGLSGDGDRFQSTYVVAGTEAMANTVAAVGLYGDNLRVGYGSLGGWDQFGPTRMITRSDGNVLYELDGQPALQLYKQYLGEHAHGLPATGLLFPLSVTLDGRDSAVVRTILAVNEEDGSLTFAGDVPSGSFARLMKANFDRLIDGAAGAARTSHPSLAESRADLAILISCVGRKLVLNQRVEEEVEAVREVLGDDTAMTGFYSYGEISPLSPQVSCELHNQTMTVTTITEI